MKSKNWLFRFSIIIAITCQTCAATAKYYIHESESDHLCTELKINGDSFNNYFLAINQSEVSGIEWRCELESGKTWKMKKGAFQLVKCAQEGYEFSGYISTYLENNKKYIYFAIEDSWPTTNNIEYAKYKSCN